MEGQVMEGQVMDNNMPEREVITLSLERGETECEVLGVFDVGDKQYIALLPLGDTDVIVFRCFEVEAGVAEIENIVDDGEYDRVTEVFKGMMGSV